MTIVGLRSGVHLHVQDLGAGPAVALIPGFGLTHEVWDRQVRMLVENGHRVVCVDLRGHGRSDSPLGGYSVEELADEVAETLTHLAIPSCAIVGHSFGGLVAFRLAAANPGLVDRLVLVSSNGVAASRTEGFPFGRAGEALLEPVVSAEHAGRVPARRAAIVAAFADPPEPAVVDWLLRMSLQMPSWSAIACFRALFSCNLVADVPGVRVPVLQIVGSADPVHSLKGTAWLQAKLADARLVEVAGSGHYPMLENPDQFDAALRDFLGDPE